MTTAQASLRTIGNFCREYTEKHASDGSKPLSEPDSIGGETKHPSKKVDDRLEIPKEGFRSAENEKDVKNDQGAVSVENAGHAKAGSDGALAALVKRLGHKQAESGRQLNPTGTAEDDHFQGGVKKSPTGGDPASETSSAKAGKEDKRQGHMGGTDTPISTENDSLDGHKWAAVTPLDKMAEWVEDTANSIAARLAAVVHVGGSKTAAAAPAPQQAASSRPVVDAATAQQIGWEMAGLINQTMDKQGADAMVRNAIGGILKQADEDAERYVRAIVQYQQKLAEGPPEGMPPEGMPPGGMPPGPPPGGGPDAAMAAMGGPGGGPPGGGESAILQQIEQMLATGQITEEDIMAALQGGGEGPPGEGPPGEGPPPESATPPGPPPGMEVTAGVKTAGAKTAEAYLRELVSRHRTRK